jgi:uncharacterized RDD family membrane protein YckC
MDIIDINTTQNVTIQYALAPVRDRILAFVIDAVVLSGSIVIFLLIITTLFPGTLRGYAWFIIIVPLFVFYSLASEIILNGQSVGKRILGIKIVKINGKEPTPYDFTVRWAFRFIDIWCSMGSIAIMLISSSERNQRLGDLLANTTVIKLNPWASIRLNDILSIKTLDSYKPVYLGVKRFSEEDMLFIKQVVERTKKHNNAAHREALNLLTEKMAGELGLATVPSNKIEFLRTVVSDFVVLSR